MGVQGEAIGLTTADVLDRLRTSRRLDLLARFGLTARGVFYLILAALAFALVLGDRGQGQANANGALSAVAGTTAGVALLIAAAVGFAAFGLLRLVGAATDRRHGRLRRLSTAGQGVLHLCLSATTVAFLLGLHAIGSEDQQRRTAGTVLDLPGGRLLLGGIGVIVLATCLWQLIVTASGGFADSLDLGDAEHHTRRFTLLAARVGIPARALSVSPIGAFLLVAAARNQPAQAKGLDGFLLELTDSWWGTALVVLVALGFAVFAVYSFLEARFRQVSAGA